MNSASGSTDSPSDSLTAKGSEGEGFGSLSCVNRKFRRARIAKNLRKKSIPVASIPDLATWESGHSVHSIGGFICLQYEIFALPEGTGRWRRIRNSQRYSFMGSTSVPDAALQFFGLDRSDLAELNYMMDSGATIDEVASKLESFGS